MILKPFYRVGRVRGWLSGALAGVVMLSLGGCVERSITLVSDPSGSLAYLNDVQQGTTPCTVQFKWYGDYSVRLRKKENVGTPLKPKYVYYYLHTQKKTHRPWFQWYGVDLFASLLPIEFKDHEIWAFIVPKVPELTTHQLIQKANKLKAELPPPKLVRP
ncbi:MAG: PEGA domain-containing protein [Phycisphaerae bacterium]